MKLLLEIIKRNWIKYSFNIILVAVICAVAYYGYREYTNLKDTLKRKEINEKYYHARIKNLKLTQVELMFAKDSLSVFIQNKLKESNIKPENTNSVTVGNLVINTTKTDTFYVDNDCSFSDTIYYNDKTILYAYARHDSISNKLIFTSKLYVKDKFAIINHTKKIYLNDYKNKWSRFWHFDWKKVKVNDIEIMNNNDIIEFDKPTYMEIEH